MISGGDGDDELVAGPGADVVTGGRGNDDVRVADGDADTVDCGPGHDTVYVEARRAGARHADSRARRSSPIPAERATDAPPSSNNIFGTPGYDDTLVGTEGADSLFGDDGVDVLFGNGGDDYVDGENDDDELHGGLGDDALHGRGGNDVILGNEGDDTITGDRGNDTINGGPGDDTIFGNLDGDIIDGDEGDDRIQVVGGGFDRVSCGDGNDIVFADATDEVAPIARTSGVSSTARERRGTTDVRADHRRPSWPRARQPTTRAVTVARRAGPPSPRERDHEAHVGARSRPSARRARCEPPRRRAARPSRGAPRSRDRRAAVPRTVARPTGDRARTLALQARRAGQRRPHPAAGRRPLARRRRHRHPDRLAGAVALREPVAGRRRAPST